MTRAYAALISVCFFWGTTYLGIRMALESFAPFTLVGIRYTVAGLLLVVAARLGGAAIPKGRELWMTSLVGVVLLGGSNLSLVLAEQTVPSGLAALFISISPFWMVGLDALRAGGTRLRAPILAGMLVGLVGSGLLVSSDLVGHNGGLLWGFLLIQFGNVCWAAGSIWHLRLAPKAHPLVSGAVQQLAAGLAIGAAGLFVPGHAITATPRGVGGLVYLILFGSIVGYSSFIYALSRLPVTIVSIYPYVNPVVAVILGWLFYREAFGLREATAMIIIFAGVAIVKRYSRPASE